jgi:hypothetical protein
MNGMSSRVIVVGGGAAGLIAAGRAAELGAQVILLEKTPRAGNKLHLTGNGRCNLTHEGLIADFLAHVPRNGSFLHNSLARFFVQDLRSLFASLGLPTVVEPDGGYFPRLTRPATWSPPSSDMA